MTNRYLEKVAESKPKHGTLYAGARAGLRGFAEGTLGSIIGGAAGNAIGGTKGGVRGIFLGDLLGTVHGIGASIKNQMREKRAADGDVEYRYNYNHNPHDERMIDRMDMVENANSILRGRGYRPSILEDNLWEMQARKLEGAYIATGLRPNNQKAHGVGLLSGVAAGLGTGAALLRHTRNEGLALGGGLAAGLGGAVLGSKLYYNQARKDSDDAHQAEANAYLDKILSKYEKEEG